MGLYEEAVEALSSQFKDDLNAAWKELAGGDHGRAVEAAGYVLSNAILSARGIAGNDFPRVMADAMDYAGIKTERIDLDALPPAEPPSPN